MGKVVVLGSINMDIVVDAERHPRVGETVAGTGPHYIPGGKGTNQAVAAARLGAKTTMVGRVGKDAFGQELLSFLQKENLDLSNVSEVTSTPTGTALITISGGHNTIVVVPGANGLVAGEDAALATVGKDDVVVAQYEIPLEAIASEFRHAKESGATTILNPAPAKALDAELLALSDHLVLNETELAHYLGVETTMDKDEAVAAVRRVRGNVQQTVTVTLGEGGAVTLAKDNVIDTAGRMVAVVDTTGAGDCFVGALAAQLAEGVLLEKALGYANLAASVSVQRLGAAVSLPTAEELVQEGG